MKFLSKIARLLPESAVKNTLKAAYAGARRLLCDRYTTNPGLFLKRLETMQRRSARDNHWADVKVWNFSEIHPERYKIMVEWLNKQVIPLLREDFVAADMPCANGEFSFLLAPLVRSIDAFDLSEHMIDLARRTSQERSITNIQFRQADALNVTFDKQYDVFLLLGLLIYIYDDNAADLFLRKVSAAVKTGSYLVVKDSCYGGGGGKDMYLTIMRKNYYAKYRNLKNILSLFEKNGFELLDKIPLKGNFKRGYCHYCALFRKKS